MLAHGIPPDFGGGVLAKGCSWLYAVAASAGLIIYFQVIPGEANLTLDVKIVAREKRESEENFYCGFCGRKVGLAYQMLPTVRCLLHVFILIFHDICCFFVLFQVVLSIFPVQLTPKKPGKPYPVDIQFSERFENQPSQCYVCIVARSAQL